LTSARIADTKNKNADILLGGFRIHAGALLPMPYSSLPEGTD